MTAKHLTTANFAEEIKEGVTLVDFWATWCPPCQMQGPIVDELADELAGQASITKVDVDEAQELAQMFGIRSIPTLIIFKDGKPVEGLVGLQTKAVLKEKIENLL